MPESCWSDVEGPDLYQGDYLPNIQVPIFHSPFDETNRPVAEANEGTEQAEVQIKDVIVISQTCDLLHSKLRFVALCPVEKIGEYERQQPQFAKRWKEVVKGRQEGLHVLGPCDLSGDYRSGLVVDFREIVSLPRGFVEQHAFECGKRLRLISPFVEHFAQAFGRFYMRVALPPDFIELP